MKKKLLLLIVLGCIACKNESKKMYVGSWATTTWRFTFHPDGTYERLSFGHYGNTKVQGEYYYKGDTIKIQSGYQGTHGTVNKEYLMVDDKIIDLTLRYDYELTTDSMSINYTSKIRDIRYPQIATDDVKQKQDVTNLLQAVLNSSKFKKYVKFNLRSEASIACEPYKFLEAQLDIDGVPIEFVSSDFLDSRPFLTFVDIDIISDDFEKQGVVEINASGEMHNALFYCNEIEGEWKCKD